MWAFPIFSPPYDFLRLLPEVQFHSLTSEEKKVPNYYMKKQLSMLDKLEGNVDSISNRISNVRTWSYVSNKSNWVENHGFQPN